MGKTPPGKGMAKDEDGGDPSMDDILASIRRILNDKDVDPDAPIGDEDDEDEEIVVSAKPADTKPPPGPGAPQAPANAAAAQATAQTASAAKPAEEPEDILILDDAMMIAENEAPKAAESLVDPTTAAAASSSVGALKKALMERNTVVSKGGLSLEDIIRDEFRPMLKSWLDTHLAGIVERLVRAEIERVVTRELS